MIVPPRGAPLLLRILDFERAYTRRILYGLGKARTPYIMRRFFAAKSIQRNPLLTRAWRRRLLSFARPALCVRISPDIYCHRNSTGENSTFLV